jgi:hypothetical protein
MSPPLKNPKEETFASSTIGFVILNTGDSGVKLCSGSED